MGRFNTTFIIGGPLVCNCPANDPSLVLDLQFASDQAYVSRRGPLPTFTRASAAWRVNSAGVIVPAAINEARIDYNPTTLACLGLPIEEQRTNLTTWSEDLTQTSWSKTNVTATANQTTAPDGSSTADLVAETTSNTQHYITGSGTVPVTSGTTYTTSVFLKKGTGATAPDWVSLLFLASAFGSKGVAFNLSTGAVGASSGGQTATVTQFPNGWWRVSMSASAISSSSTVGLFIGFTDNTNTIAATTYTGKTTSDVFVWGAQFEAGAFATSYIPTTSAVVRSADVCSITGSAFTSFWNAPEGTLVFRGIKQALQPTATPSYLGVDDGAATNRIILFGGAAETAIVSASSTIQATLGGVTQAAALTSFAIAMRYKANDFAFCLNGGTVYTDTSGTVPTVTQMLIGTRLGSNFMGGWIQSAQYYNRIKTDAQLQTLSTP